MIRRQRPHPCDPRPRALAECAPRSAGGATAVEFAIVAPVLLMLLFGILVYGGYFLMSHSVQQLANDAARAAVGGMTDAERQQLAAGTLASELPTYGYLSPASTQLTYTDQAGVMTVAIDYDASGSPLWALSGLIPMPSTTIVRSASVQVGGF
jgi:Flp pilus assembly protein TadG